MFTNVPTVIIRFTPLGKISNPLCMQNSLALPKKRLIDFLVAVTIASSALMTNGVGQGVQSNEFLAANKDSVVDADGDASDWVELFNAGAG